MTVAWAFFWFSMGLNFGIVIEQAARKYFDARYH
jgi:hypothetical protein